MQTKSARGRCIKSDANDHARDNHNRGRERERERGIWGGLVKKIYISPHIHRKIFRTFEILFRITDKLQYNERLYIYIYIYIPFGLVQSYNKSSSCCVPTK